MASSPYTLGVALVELAKTERAVQAAQSRLLRLTAQGAATDADRNAFTAVATTLFAIENSIYAQILLALNTLPDAVANPLIQQIPAPVLLVTPAPPSSAKNPIAVPPAVLWALVVAAVLLAAVVAIAVVWTISITVDTIANIILTYEQASIYSASMQQRIDCLNGGHTAADCNASLPLPAPPTAPTPPSTPNPNLPWYVGGALLGMLGLTGMGLYALERKRRGG